MTLLYLLLRNHGTEWGKFWLNILDGLVRYFIRYFHRAKLQTIDLPEKGPALVVCNHVSGLDPLLLIAASHRPLRFIIAREEYDRFLLRWVFRYADAIRVERERHPERAVRQALRALRNGEVVMVFPHGKIHLDSEPPLKLKRGAVKLSQWSGAPIYPCRIEGVKGQGKTILALFRRGNPVLVVKSPLVCGAETEQLCTDYLRSIIERVE